MNGGGMMKTLALALSFAGAVSAVSGAARAGNDMYKPNVGDRWVFTDDEVDKVGGEAWITVAKVEDGMVTLVNSSGCTEIRRLSFVFPVEKYTNCNGATGGRTIKSVKGNIFPLRVGNTQIVAFEGKDNLTPRGWRGERKCRVVSKTRIDGKFQAHDTFKIVCEDAWYVRTWYYDPNLESSVRFDMYDKRKRTDRKLQLIRFEKKK